MNREIKFRAWFDKQMCYADKRPNPFYIAIHPSGAPSIVLLFDKTNEPHFIGEGRLESLMQFTGLKDKNGNEIYEGDVLDDKSGRHCVVFSWGSFLAENVKYKSYFAHISDLDDDTLEVIGNVYESPNLLKP